MKDSFVFRWPAMIGVLIAIAVADPPTAHAANQAEIQPGASRVPDSMSPSSTAAVRVRVQNTGTTTWTAGTLYRLGALSGGSSNQVTWSGFPCGGYMKGPLDGRVFLCQDVPPGAAHDLDFDITVPPGITGSVRFGVRMVRDGFEWFGQSYAWTIAVSGDPGLPDMIVDSVAVSPSPPDAGQQARFTSVVRNIGNAPTPSGVAIGVGYRVDGRQVSWGVVQGPLAPGASVPVGTQGGTWTATAGDHTLTAVVDDVNRFPESNEANNTRSVSFAVGGASLPDVIVDSISVSPSHPDAGQQVRFTSVVRNVGNVPTPSGVVIGVGYRVDGRQVSWGVVQGPLAPGASVTVGTQGGTWTATSGAHTLTAVVDDVNRFPESNETNNSRSLSFSVAGSGLPDVIVDSVALSPPDPIAGQQVRFTSVVRNVGSAPTPSGVVIGVGYRVDGGQVTWGAVQGPLGPGASVTVGTQGGTWRATVGAHTLTALVDDIDRFPESNETNNTRSVSFEVRSSAEVANLYGMNIDPANPKGRPSAQELKAIGVRWLRVEWKITHGFIFYDPILTDYRAAGLKVLLLLDYSTVPDKPASTAGDAQWTAYRSRFLQGVDELAGHYRDSVDAWQVWNEPDLFQPGTAYDPGVPARHYGLMLRDAARAIRLYSSRPIVSGGLTTANPSYLDAARQSAGVLNVDAIAIHPYGRRAPDDWPHPSWGFGNMSELFERFLRFDLPLWVTEIGTVDQPIQAQYLENVYQLVRDEYLDRVPVVFWFCWSDGMVSPHGIVDWDGSPKPSYHRYQSVAPPW